MDESTKLSAIDTVPAPADAVDAAPVLAAAPPAPPPPVPPPISDRARQVPVQQAERFVTLDVVRGMALCGILLVNMENFAMVREARYDPAISGGTSRLDHLIWLGTYLLADTKFIAVFTMLFGAGIAAADERRRKRQTVRTRWTDYRSILFLFVAAAVYWTYYMSGDTLYFRAYWALWCLWVFAVPRAEAVHYRRLLFLAGVGAAHGLYLWRGDILYFYAFWGLALYFAPRLPAPLLALAGLGTYAYFVGQFSLQLLDVSDGYSWWERVIFQGRWWDQYRYRLDSEDFYLRVLPIEFSTHLIGLMLCGMALFKTGFLTGRGATWVYTGIAAISLMLGAGLVADGTALSTNFAGQFESKEFVWGSLLLSLGYMSAAIALTKAVGPRAGLGGFVALGRMAFTNYLMQTVLCTTLFYGYGFGLFDRVTRTEQLGIVAAILACQMVFSLVWLKFFQFGPLEWVWRSFSYWRLQPLWRAGETAGESPAAA
jgi:uncharacterized protein